MIQVAKRYKISDVALKKVCVKMDVPVPPRGYWAKLQAGKKVSKLSLGKLAPGKKDRARILGACVSFAEEFRQIDVKELRKESEKVPGLSVSDRLSKLIP